MGLSKFEENDLLLRLSQGDGEAFARIYERYWQLLYDTACQRLSDADQAEDVVQDVFVNLWEQRESLSIENLKPYLQTAVRHRIYNLVARDKVKDSYFAYLSASKQTGNLADDPHQYKELRQRYQALLDSMPKRLRQVFELRYEADMDTRHIAKELNISQKTVQNQLLKAVSYVKTIFTSLLLWLIH